MRIAYLAKFGSGGGDDEGAITHALEALGHTVDRLREARAHVLHKISGDFLLFHHCHQLDRVRAWKGLKVFWCFDLIDAKDPAVAARSATRMKWAREATEVCDLGFCTDGDWVAQDTTGKLHWLPQGYDERRLKLNPPIRERRPLLFLGITKNGGKRMSFVDEMRVRYGDRFHHIEHGVYGEKFVEAVRGADINLAPDGPVSDRYWSNRIYNILGAGGFLLHPYSEGLAEAYPGSVGFYHSRTELHEAIAFYQGNPELRESVAATGAALTQARHLYRHRLEKLLAIVKEKLL